MACESDILTNTLIGLNHNMPLSFTTASLLDASLLHNHSTTITSHSFLSRSYTSSLQVTSLVSVVLVHPSVSALTISLVIVTPHRCAQWSSQWLSRRVSSSFYITVAVSLLPHPVCIHLIEFVYKPTASFLVTAGTSSLASAFLVHLSLVRYLPTVVVPILVSLRSYALAVHNVSICQRSFFLSHCILSSSSYFLVPSHSCVSYVLRSSCSEHPYLSYLFFNYLTTPSPRHSPSSYCSSSHTSINQSVSLKLCTIRHALDTATLGLREIDSRCLLNFIRYDILAYTHLVGYLIRCCRITTLPEKSWS